MPLTSRVKEPEEYILYVGKHGSDLNSGFNKDFALLTFTKAIEKAILLSPGPNNRIAIHCVDAGAYIENLTVPSWCGILGAACLIQGNHILTDNSLLHSFRLTASSGTIITKVNGSGIATLECERMILSGDTDGVVCLSGTINYYGQNISIEDGYGIGNGTTGEINADVNQIFITGTGCGLGMTSSGTMHFNGSIKDSGSGYGIFAGGTSEIGVLIDYCDCNIAYYVEDNATLNGLFANINGTRSGNGTKNITVAGSLEQQPQEMIFSLPLRGTSDGIFNFIGEYRTVDTSQTGNYTTDFDVGNNKTLINVNSLTGTGTITITGGSVTTNSSVVVPGDTEVITVDATGRYQTNKRWWEVTDITIADFTAINYDIEVIGYPDLGSTNFRIIGYRIEAYAQGLNPDLGFDIYKIKDNDNNKCELIQLESMGVDANNATNQIVDLFRSGGDDRSYNPADTVWDNDKTIVFKQMDFDDYFTNNENYCYSLDKNEGFIVRLRGEDGSGSGDISNVDFIHMWIKVGNIL